MKGWSEKQLAELKEQFVKSTNKKIEDLTAMDIKLLGNILCGFSHSELYKLSIHELKKSLKDVGQLSDCSAEQFSVLSDVATYIFGPVITWKASLIMEAGNLATGWSPSTYNNFNTKQTQFISCEVIRHLPVQVKKQLNKEFRSRLSWQQQEALMNNEQEIGLRSNSSNHLNIFTLNEKPSSEDATEPNWSPNDYQLLEFVQTHITYINSLTKPVNSSVFLILIAAFFRL